LQSSYSQPATYPYSTPTYTGPVRTHSGPSLHHHSSGNYHYSTYHSAPPRQRVSWAPEQEKEVKTQHIICVYLFIVFRLSDIILSRGNFAKRKTKSSSAVEKAGSNSNLQTGKLKN
jgi:hypothetical protein